MKKVLGFILAVCMILSMVACAGNNAPADAAKTPSSEAAAQTEATKAAAPEKKELKKFTLGLMDPGAWNAAYGPVMDQIEALKEDLNFETIYWAGVKEEDRETLKNYKYYVGGFYEDEEYAGYWQGKAAGEAGCKNLCLIGAPDGLDFTIRRNKGLQKACEEYGITILAQERDLTLTGSAAGGMDIVNRFLATYPECDGIIIQGRTHSCLAGVVNGLADAGKTADIPIFAIDCNINQTEYFKNGQEAGVIGGHHLGGMYGVILLTNIMNGTPLTNEKVYLLNRYVELTSYEQCVEWAYHIWDNNAYTGEEILPYIKAYNPNATYEDLVALTESYSLDDIIARHGHAPVES